MFGLIPFVEGNSVWNYHPFRELENFQKSFFGTLNPSFSSGSMKPFRTDVKELENAYELQADLPGCRKEDIELQIEDDVLTIQAQRNAEQETRDDQTGYVRVERSRGKYARSFNVSGIDTDAITARYADGVLTVNLPKAAPEKPAAKKVIVE